MPHGPGETPRDDADRRASRRRMWPVRSFALGEEPSDDLSATTTAEERLAMVAELTRELWTLTGDRLPDYPRSEAPVRKLLRRVS